MHDLDTIVARANDLIDGQPSYETVTAITEPITVTFANGHELWAAVRGAGDFLVTTNHYLETAQRMNLPADSDVAQESLADVEQICNGLSRLYDAVATQLAAA